MPNGLNRTGTNRRWLEHWPREFALCATLIDGFIKPVSDGGEELVALMKNRIVSERGRRCGSRIPSFPRPDPSVRDRGAELHSAGHNTRHFSLLEFFLVSHRRIPPRNAFSFRPRSIPLGNWRKRCTRPPPRTT